MVPSSNCGELCVSSVVVNFTRDQKQLRQVAQLSQRDRLQGGLVMAKSGRLELGDNIYGHYRSMFHYCDVIGQQRQSNSVKKNAK